MSWAGAGREAARLVRRAAWIAAGSALDWLYAGRAQISALAARPALAPDPGAHAPPPGASAGGRRDSAPSPAPPTGPRSGDLAVVRTTPGTPGGGLPAIVLVPGIYEPAAFLSPLREWLHERGHRVVEVPALGWNLHTVPASAELVVQRLEELGIRGAVLLAHSKGGLIGKQLMVSGPPGLAAGMIAVNTPFEGHRFSRLGPTEALRGFHTRHPVILSLAAELEVNARIVTVSAEVDPVAMRGMRLAGARNLTVPVVGHFRILGHPLFLARLAEVLDTHRFPPLGAPEGETGSGNAARG
ncbi:hypothetical protein [Sinomonas halotolerans]|uniref:Alpha/beta hydrolase n=1 Tax=Sinomonas halotolerans TaxID=1644133 RepID=A0ABU9WY33_9MICC